MPVYQLILNIIFGIVGVTGVIALIIYINIKVLEKCVIEKYKNKLDKKLEKFKQEQTKEIEKIKAQLGNKSYVTKARFDKEFEIYQELMDVCVEFYDESILLTEIAEKYYYNTYDKSEFEKIIVKAKKSSIKALKLFNKRAPFAKKEILDKYYALAINTSKIITCGSFLIDDKKDYVVINKRSYNKKETIELLNDLMENDKDMFFEVIDDVREYLNSLDVIE